MNKLIFIYIVRFFASNNLCLKINKISSSEGFLIDIFQPENKFYLRDHLSAFFKTMKKEEVYFKDYKTMNDVIKNLPRFIDEIYNKKRLHSSLGYKTPEAFEKEVMKLKPADRPVQKLWGWIV